MVIDFTDMQVAIEIKGVSTRSLNKSMLDKMCSNVATYLKEYPGSSIHAKVLLLNDQFSKAPEVREPYAPDLIEYATEYGITVLSTPQFMELAALYLMQKMSSEQMFEIINTPGLVDLADLDWLTIHPPQH